ncbi:hypothetical protein PSMK_p00210 (plasmid) [Phycisphaera mikurensis NBRC 102666]|uniref:Uncharacterized protein n=1 Tax=Phycisphaera mikurensis (strain NBRC 102666 / KCTC 22515 / FYK2301M01) TaxID=1142394 RepID=I0IJE5_PHYMF|nr:hypothetical protein PSMK_p00210 [Phycisphaera mikurensis NBRC 102666]
MRPEPLAPGRSPARRDTFIVRTARHPLNLLLGFTGDLGIRAAASSLIATDLPGCAGRPYVDTVDLKMEVRAEARAARAAPDGAASNRRADGEA